MQTTLLISGFFFSSNYIVKYIQNSFTTKIRKETYMWIELSSAASIIDEAVEKQYKVLWG